MWLKISDRAMNRIVSAAAASVPGTTELNRSRERIAGRTYPRYDVIVDDAAGTCSVEAFIAVTWPSPVTSVAEAVRATITDWIHDYTGLTVTRVNVIVGPVVAGDRTRRITPDLVAANPTHPQLRAIATRPLRVTHPSLSASRHLQPVTVASPTPLRPIRVTPITPVGEKRRRVH